MASDTIAPAVPSSGPRVRRSLPVWLPLLVVYLVWGSTYLGIREAIRTMPPMLMASARFLAAGAILYLFAVRRGGATERAEDRPGFREWRSAAIVGTLLFAGGNGGVVWAETRVPTGVVALLVATVPLWMVLLDRIGFGRKPTWREVLGVTVGFGGMILLIGAPGGRPSSRIDVLGALVVVFGALCWATGSLYSRAAPHPRRLLVGAGMQMLCGGVSLAVLGIIGGEPGRLHPSQISMGSWVGLVYLIVFGSLIAFSAYTWLLRHVRTTLVATYAYVNPVVAVALGWAALGERLTVRTAVAGAVILVAVALIVTARARSTTPAEAT
jgi:drug/metabolite transporter (DMT)-like permease